MHVFSVALFRHLNGTWTYRTYVCALHRGGYGTRYDYERHELLSYLFTYLTVST